MIDPKKRKALAAPFPLDEISFLVKHKKGWENCYLIPFVPIWAVEKRLCDVLDSWSIAGVLIGDSAVVVQCLFEDELHVGIGDLSNGDNAVTKAVTQAIKRAAKQAGIALSLDALPVIKKPWHEDAYPNYKDPTTADLPDWACDKGKKSEWGTGVHTKMPHTPSGSAPGAPKKAAKKAKKPTPRTTTDSGKDEGALHEWYKETAIVQHLTSNLDRYRNNPPKAINALKKAEAEGRIDPSKDFDAIIDAMTGHALLADAEEKGKGKKKGKKES